MNKYNYLTVIQGYYADYWEDVSEYEGPDREKEARKDIAEYRMPAADGGHQHRIVRRRVLNPDHAPTVGAEIDGLIASMSTGKAYDSEHFAFIPCT